MKKSSTWMMLAPGLIILLLCLGLPLIFKTHKYDIGRF